MSLRTESESQTTCTYCRPIKKPSESSTVADFVMGPSAGDTQAARAAGARHLAAAGAVTQRQQSELRTRSEPLQQWRSRASEQHGPEPFGGSVPNVCPLAPCGMR